MSGLLTDYYQLTMLDAYLREGMDEFLDYLRTFRFQGDVYAMPEGTLFFAEEPIVRAVAPLPQAQLIETRLLNIVHFQTLIASKAARIGLAAAGRPLVDFGMRRAHGAEAATSFNWRTRCRWPLPCCSQSCWPAGGFRRRLPCRSNLARVSMRDWHASATIGRTSTGSRHEPRSV